MWKGFNNNKIKSGYNSLANHTPEDVSPRTTTAFDWIKDLWASECSPKLKVFMWSIIQAGACNASPQGRHCKCGAPLKDEVHLATDDTFEAAVVRFRSTICLPPSGVPNTILPWICWSIWKDRNSLTFENKLSQPEEVTTKGLAWTREWNQAQSSKMNLQITNLQADRPGERIIEAPFSTSPPAERMRLGMQRGRKRA
ncbi:hypothetical protein F2Q69_00017325 [Brassica cretica]|uniref:Reverse transcriptase zinc-binding domain-containing protein n=1 Tax=Brassica cretica TaxID=69181 RepID=A0A8S9R7U1_BRACR|nr:hypothetical protein F2Q69_00017325 [Brassica cretica]